MPRSTLNSRDSVRRALAREIGAYRRVAEPAPSVTARFRSLVYGLNILTSLLDDSAAAPGESDLLKWLGATYPAVRQAYADQFRSQLARALRDQGNVRPFSAALGG